MAREWNAIAALIAAAFASANDPGISPDKVTTRANHYLTWLDGKPRTARYGPGNPPPRPGGPAAPRPVGPPRPGYPEPRRGYPEV